MEERQAPAGQHKLILNNRSKVSLNGITDILSFDVNEILIETELGMLMIRGKDLHVNRLTLEKGEVDVDGTVDSLVYSSNEALRRSGESFLKRLFR